MINLSFNETLINNYIEKCNIKIDYHKINARHARLWNNFISTGNIFLSSLSSLLMVIFTVVHTPESTISIISGCLFFTLTISNKVKDDFNFLSLSISHHNSMDAYSDIKYELEKLINSTEDLEQNIRPLIDIIILKYGGVNQKSHHQSVRWCFYGCCLF